MNRSRFCNLVLLPLLWLQALSGACLVASANPASNDFLAKGQYHVAKFSGDGKLLLTGSGTPTPVAQIWDMQSGKLVQQFNGHRASIHSVAISPDGQYILTGAGNATVAGLSDTSARVWDLVTGKQRAVLRPGGSYILSAQFFPDGRRVLTTGRNNFDRREDFGVVWDWATQTKLVELKGLTCYSPEMKLLQPAIVAPDGNCIAGLVDDGKQLRLWNAANGKALWSATGATRNDGQEGFGSVKFSPDGKSVLAACSDKTVIVWDVRTGKVRQVFKGHQDRIRSAAFCFDGNRVMTASIDGTCRLWQTKSGRQLAVFQHAGPVVEMVLTVDGKKMGTKWRQVGDDGKNVWHVSQWNVGTRKLMQRNRLGSIRGTLIYDPTGEKAIMNNGFGATVLFDAKTGAEICKFTPKSSEDVDK